VDVKVKARRRFESAERGIIELCGCKNSNADGTLRSDDMNVVRRWGDNRVPVLAAVLGFVFLVSFQASARCEPVRFTRITTGSPGAEVNNSWGAAWVDYDNDEYLDLFVANGQYFKGINNSLWRNNTDGSFTQVSGGVIVNDGLSSASATWGDYDNDGDLDAFVANGHLHDNRLYTNQGDGSFAEYVGGHVVNDGGASSGPSWVDYDLDGDLDLFVPNPGPLPGAENFLYANIDNRLERRLGLITNDATASHCACWGDYDDDGDPDLFIANMLVGLQTNHLYRNDGGGIFVRVSTVAGVADRGDSRGCSWGDCDNDGDLDLFVANADGDNFLYKNRGDGTFRRVINGPHVNDGACSFGSCWGDFNNDGHLDLFVSNYAFRWTFPTTNLLYLNNGNGQFSRVYSGAIVTDEGFWDGAACGDYDRDGDLDIFVTTETKDFANGLYRNNGNSNNWINIKCIGTMSNASAIGAVVRVCTGTDTPGVLRWQMREISSQTGYFAQSSLNAHFGLSDAAIVDSVIVEWPSGHVDLLAGVEPNQFLTITEGATTAPVAVSFDIRPGSCPNPFNSKWSENAGGGNSNDDAGPKKRGVVPTAIVGSESFDVSEIDVSSLLLMGVAPIRHSYEDVAAPYGGDEECGCTNEGSDGYMDLTLKFPKALIAQAMDAVYNGNVVPLTITGQLRDGTQFEGEDCVWVRSKVEAVSARTGNMSIILGSAVPNPFNPVTQISYYLPKEEFVELNVYDVRGRLLERLVARIECAGEHVVEWDARGAPSGTYFYRLQVGDLTETRKMILVR
jgi:hypothetical protein